MNLVTYLNNPMGKGSSVMGASSIKANLNADFELLKNRINYKTYVNKKRTKLVYIVQIPSRKAKDVLYDVVIEYEINDNTKEINNLDFKVFSNCPSFVYTYAYVFFKKKILCTWLKDKYSKEVLKDRPDEKNEYQIINFERSLYLALKYISLYGRGEIDHAIRQAENVDKYSDLAKLIKSDTEVKEIYDKSIKKIREESKKEDKKSSTSNRVENSIHKKKSKSAVKSTSKTKKVGKTKKTESIKKTKRI